MGLGKDSYGSDGKESTCNAGDLGSVPGFGRYPGEGNGYNIILNKKEFKLRVTKPYHTDISCQS